MRFRPGVFETGAQRRVSVAGAVEKRGPLDRRPFERGCKQGGLGVGSHGFWPGLGLAVAGAGGGRSASFLLHSDAGAGFPQAS